jgi:hypothetical protein
MTEELAPKVPRMPPTTAPIRPTDQLEHGMGPNLCADDTADPPDGLFSGDCRQRDGQGKGISKSRSAAASPRAAMRSPSRRAADPSRASVAATREACHPNGVTNRGAGNRESRPHHVAYLLD